MAELQRARREPRFDAESDERDVVGIDGGTQLYNASSSSMGISPSCVCVCVQEDVEKRGLVSKNTIN